MTWASNLISLFYVDVATYACLNPDAGLAMPLQWDHNEPDGVSNHQPRDCLFSRLIRRRSKKTSKLRVTGLCAGNSPVTGEFPAQMASNAENVSIWWRHQALSFQVVWLICDNCYNGICLLYNDAPFPWFTKIFYIKKMIHSHVWTECVKSNSVKNNW